MMKVAHFSLPNLLAKRELIKELIQQDATSDNIVTQVSLLLESDNVEMLQQFSQLQSTLCCNASEQAATEVLALINK